MLFKPDDERFTPSLKLDGEQPTYEVSKSGDEKVLSFVRFNQEAEGFEVTPELEEEGRQILSGEKDIEAAIKETISSHTQKK